MRPLYKLLIGLLGLMLSLKSINFLRITPVLQSSACRIASFFSQQDLRPQCLSANLNGDIRSSSPHLPVTPSSSYSTASPQSSAQHSFSYRVGASFSAKGRRFEPKTNQYYYNPSDGIRSTGRPASGQDAFFISRIGNGTSTAFGVADGVGGWVDSGIDPAHFSHGLCENMIKTAENSNATEESTLNAQKLLQSGFDAVVADESITGGGSTACVSVGKGDGSLQVAK